MDREFDLRGNRWIYSRLNTEALFEERCKEANLVYRFLLFLESVPVEINSPLDESKCSHSRLESIRYVSVVGLRYTCSSKHGVAVLRDSLLF